MAKSIRKKSMSGHVKKISPIKLTTKHGRWEETILLGFQKGQTRSGNVSVPAFGNKGNDTCLWWRWWGTLPAFFIANGIAKPAPRKQASFKFGGGRNDFTAQFEVWLMGCSANIMDFCKTFESVLHNIPVTESIPCNINKEYVKWIKNCPMAALKIAAVSGQWSLLSFCRVLVVDVP